MSRAVEVGQVWKRRDPNGEWIEFEIVRIGKNPYGQPSADGRTPSGKIIKCGINPMLKDTERFVFVNDDRVRRAG